MTDLLESPVAEAAEAIFFPDRSKPYQRPAFKSLPQLLRDRASTAPDAAVIGAAGQEPLNYSGLWKQTERTVGSLRAFGIKANDRVAVVLPNGPLMAVSFLAIASGATCAPLNPAYRESEFDFYLSDLNAKALVILEGLESPSRKVAAQRNIPVIELRPATGGPAGIFELVGAPAGKAAENDFAEPEHVALVLHTSGTTSRPKIVPLSHSNLCHSGHNIAITFELTEADRCVNIMPLFHIHGLMGALLSSLSAGGSVFCAPGFDPDKFFTWMDSFKANWFSAVPTMLQAIIARGEQHKEVIKRNPLRFIRSSSAALAPTVLKAIEETFNAPMIETYGMTEASHQMAANPLPPLAHKPGSVGRAAGPDIAIMDEAGNLLPQGAIGEVVIRGANVTTGYENNPKANSASFTYGWFRTGDQGRFDSDGYLYLTSRLKEIINRGGEKIAPKEIDEVLLQHPAVAQAVAFAAPHPTLEEDVAAAIILKKGSTATDVEIRKFAAERLVDFKVPNQILIVDEIPKGPTGKLQRIGLADKLADQLKKNFVAADSGIEKDLAELWASILKIEKAGIRDNFFALGGDSLRAAAMLIQVEKRYQKVVPVDSFVRTPTIVNLAAMIEGKVPVMPPVSGNVPGHEIKDNLLSGIKNRLFQILALYIPGFKSTRVWLHRMRGVTIGSNVSIGTGAIIETAYPRLVWMGDNVSIGMRAIVIGHLRDLTAQARAGHAYTVRIEDEAYIGPGVIILPNVTIGKGAVVSAGSVVSSSVPPNTLVRGNPAVPIARCGVSLGGGVSYEQFLRNLTPIESNQASGTASP